MARSLMIATAPESEKVDAEYTDLTGHKVLCYVWVKPETLWDYPQIRLDLAAHLTSYFKQNVKKIEVVEAPLVESYLKSLSSMNPDPTEIGRHFRVDRVVHLSVYKFSMRDPGMSQFYRGRISASVVVYDLSRKDEPAKTTTLTDVAVAVPEEGPLGYYNVTADQMRDLTYRAFTEAVGRKFHEWEKELD